MANSHSNILLYCMISTVISSNLIINYSFKLQFNHIIFYHLESFYCSLHCGRQLDSMQKMHLTKSGGLRSWKALDFKKWGGSSLGALQKFTPMMSGESTEEDDVTGA